MTILPFSFPTKENSSLYSLHFSILCLLLPTFLHTLYNLALPSCCITLDFLSIYILLAAVSQTALPSHLQAPYIEGVFDFLFLFSCQCGLAFALKFQRSHVAVLRIYLTGLFVLSIRIV